jgi:4-hydroxy-tetrahydrodipicolinate reductase
VNGAVKLAVVGASGRMGRAVVRLAGQEKLAQVVFAMAAHLAGHDVGELAGEGALGVLVEDSLDGLARSGAQVVIDFSSADSCAKVARAAAAAGLALISGTTGIDAEARAALDEAATRVPVLWEANMSVGVHVLAALVKQAALALGPDFHAEIVEVHHAAKVDAPSGTALMLAEALLPAGEREPCELVHGRHGRPGPRGSELGVHAVRGGDVIGDHTVHFLGPGERLELTHRATNRDLFARGALRAAAAIVGRPPGRYRLGALVLGSTAVT